MFKEQALIILFYVSSAEQTFNSSSARQPDKRECAILQVRTETTVTA